MAIESKSTALVEPTGPRSWRDKVIDDLGWPLVLARFAEYAVNERTVEGFAATLPFEDRERAAEMHTWVREAITLERADTRLPIRRLNTLDDVLGTLRRGAPATGPELRDVALCIEQALSIRGHVFTHAAHCPTLQRTFEVNPSLGDLGRTLRAALDEKGDLYDGASETLRTARRELAKARDALRNEQAQLLRKYKEQLAGQFFAEREGRFVLPFRTDAGRVEGTVLGSSSSGSTLYVEPAELLEKNNRTRIAEAHVQREEARLLAELSALASARVPELEAAYEACLLADRVAACAAWAIRHEATPISFVAEPVLQLVHMRHPLLLPTTRHTLSHEAADALGPRPVVGNDLELSPGQALIVSGPNAGGKTVALKCLGLAAWLARSGLPVPCRPESRIGWFDEVFTDIGDDQSISRSLSTFTAHVVNLSHCLSVARRGVLLLLDEVAGGTDPDEGAALAEALLDAFTRAGASVATTTHYERLKRLGARDGGRFRNASVGFDMQQMRPTFRVTMGVPGASSALAVAERYGIPPEVVTAARDSIPKANRDQQQLIQQLEQELSRAAVARETAETLAREAERRKEAVEREREHALRNDRLALEKLSAELTKEVQAARSDLRRAKALLGTGTKEAYREAELLVSHAALPITVDGALTRAVKLGSNQSHPAADSRPLTVGMVVRLVHLNAEATVVEAPAKGQVRVSVNGLKMTVPVEQVHTSKSSRAPKGGKKPTGLTSHAPQRSTTLDAPAAEAIRTAHNTCDLRGVRVDDGLIQVDRFLDELLRMREPVAFILHGHGTGAMKSAVREHLAASRMVRRSEPAPHELGGDAFTIAWLR